MPGRKLDGLVQVLRFDQDETVEPHPLPGERTLLDRRPPLAAPDDRRIGGMKDVGVHEVALLLQLRLEVPGRCDR